jgi:uroporphyrinogen decarboxylase
MDDLIEIGVNALHPIEPKAMDIAEVKRRVGRKLCLIGNIDLGYTLTRGTPEEVRAEVRERIRTCAPGGGYCVGSSNTVTNYVPLANYKAMIEASREFGTY